MKNTRSKAQRDFDAEIKRIGKKCAESTYFMKEPEYAAARWVNYMLYEGGGSHEGAEFLSKLRPIIEEAIDEHQRRKP